MLKYIMILFLGTMFLGITGCKLETPEIRGIVLDAETKEPVEGAWVSSASIGITTKTVAGDVGQVISIEPPHLRTDKDGRFIIPRRELKKPPFPVSFGSEVDEFTIGVVTIDKSGSLKLDPIELNKRRIDIVIYVEGLEEVYKKALSHYPPERFEYGKELSIFSGLQSLYNYCLTGRSSIEIHIEPPGGCDEWELNFAITEHERYLERYSKEFEKELEKHKQGLIKDYRDNIIIHYGGILEQLGELYERKGEYAIAIENLKKAREIRFFRPQDLEYKIKTLQQKLQQKQK